MKKIQIICLFIILLFSCKKEEQAFLEYPEFKDIVGKWESITGELKSVEIDPKGRVSTAIDTERGEKFKMNEFNIIHKFNSDGSDSLWKINCANFKKSEYINSLSIHKKPYNDTCKIYLGWQINDFVVLNGAPLFVRVK